MIRSLWRFGGRLDDGATYYFYKVAYIGGMPVPVNARLISVADFWAGRAA